MGLLESRSGLQVLVVDDDPTVRRALTRALRQAGHEVVAVERCGKTRGLDRAFDVAVLDLELPDGTGVDVAGELLGLGTAGNVVFFSGAFDPLLLGRAARLGAVFSKSDSLDRLLAAVSSLRDNATRVRRDRRSRPQQASS